MADLEAFQSSSEESEAEPTYALHDAAEAGDAALLDRLLEEVAGEAEGEDAIDKLKQAVSERDRYSCTPLHIALLQGHLECVETLLNAGASVQLTCEGSPPLHIAVCTASCLLLQASSITAAQKLLEKGADPFRRDDHGRTALHWASSLGLTTVALPILGFSVRDSAVTAAAVAAAVSPEAASELPMKLLSLEDKHGNTALHLAARSGHAELLQLLLTQGTGWSEPHAAFTSQTNRLGYTPLHYAALSGCQRSMQQLQNAGPGAVSIKDKHGHTPADLAHRRGHANVVGKVPGTVADVRADAFATQASMQPQTTIIAPRECQNHLTCPEPITRQGAEPPPENVGRLQVLTEPGRGILQSLSFQDVRWVTHCNAAPIGHVLRVHEWPYVRMLQQACNRIADSPDTTGELDSDTGISHGSYKAAMVAAGAVCQGVDMVATGQARNVFCAVRPPGHHAGPNGIVTNENDATGSHGFCLLNNVAIAAAHAMNLPNAGLKRIAILDFDVHHGNGTQACVGAVMPFSRTETWGTMHSKGTLTTPVFRPWLDWDDSSNIFFGSVQGFGLDEESGATMLYPGSGATCDSMSPFSGDVPAAVPNGSLHVTDHADSQYQDEFASTGQEAAPDQKGPRIINVGISGPGVEAAKWRRAWRDKILPALVQFHPDLILISAGFDAHRKDLLNQEFIGLHERDYDWVTQSIVQVANLCCEGRIVSALEGGYRIHGGIVSAFARSVAAHVNALKQPHRQVWDAQEAEQDRKKDAQKRAVQAAAEAAAAAAAAADASSMPAVLAAALGVDVPVQSGADALMPSADAFAAMTGSMDQDGATSPQPDRKRRRGGSVPDYVALSRKLDQEEATGS